MKLSKQSTIMISVTVILLVCALAFCSIHLGQYQSDQISKIVVWNGLNGGEFEITDADTISEVINHLNGLAPSLGIRTRPTGCHYAVHLYDRIGNTIAVIELADDSVMFIDRCTYWVQTLDIIEYLQQLENHT